MPTKCRKPTITKTKYRLLLFGNERESVRTSKAYDENYCYFILFSLDIKQKEMFAEFLEDLSKNVHSGNTTDISINKLDELNAIIRKMELPKTRVEFEIRANLFYLTYEMKNYLNIKKKLFAKRN